jgi:hypothetical protein
MHLCNLSYLLPDHATLLRENIASEIKSLPVIEVWMKQGLLLEWAKDMMPFSEDPNNKVQEERQAVKRPTTSLVGCGPHQNLVVKRGKWQTKVGRGSLGTHKRADGYPRFWEGVQQSNT